MIFFMNKSFLFITLLALLTLFWVFIRHQSDSYSQTELDSKIITATQNAAGCIPTFLDGGGPYYESNTPFRENLAPENHSGTELTVTGRVLNSDCTRSMGGVIVDIWQANESGNYDDLWYRGRVLTSDDGTYTFTTVIPRGYGEGTAFRPPHIHFKIWQESTEIITSQMFLPESRNQGIEEAYIMELSQLDDESFLGKHDIILP